MTTLTFQQIEQAKGIKYSADYEHSPLSDWYHRMRDVPLSAFGIEDLCKSVRQDLYPDHVIPVAIDALEKEPMAGEMYDGELALSFRFVSDNFWSKNLGLAQRLLHVLRKVVALLEDEDEFKADALETIGRIEHLTNRDP